MDILLEDLGIKQLPNLSQNINGSSMVALGMLRVAAGRVGSGNRKISTGRVGSGQQI